MKSWEQFIHALIFGSIVILLPFVFLLPLHTLKYQQYMAIIAVSLATLCGILLFRTKTNTLSLSRGDLFLLLYIAYGGCHYLISRENLPGSLFASWCIIVSTYIIARNLSNCPISLILYISCLLQTILALGQAAGIFSSGHPLFEITGSFWNPSQLGGFIACFIPLVIGDMSKRKHPVRLVCLILPLLVVLVLSDSRAAWLACIIATLHVLRVLPQNKKQTTLTIVGGLIIGIALLLYKPQSALGRLDVWKITGEMIADHPIEGHGIHSFNRHYMLQQAEHFARNPEDPFASSATTVTTPYNEWLHILVEQGIIGLALFLLFCGNFFTRSPFPANRKYTSSILAFLVFACFSYPGENTALLAGIALCTGTFRDKPIVTVNRQGISRFFPPVVAIIIAAINIGIALNYAKNSSRLHQLSPGIPVHAFRNEPESLQYILQNLPQLSTRDKTLILQRIAELFPNPETYCSLGLLLEQQGLNEQAEALYHSAADMIPNQIRANYYIFKLHERTGDKEKTDQIAARILHQRVKIENSFTIGVKAEVRKYLSTNNNTK